MSNRKFNIGDIVVHKTTISGNNNDRMIIVDYNPAGQGDYTCKYKDNLGIWRTEVFDDIELKGIH